MNHFQNFCGNRVEFWIPKVDLRQLSLTFVNDHKMFMIKIAFEKNKETVLKQLEHRVLGLDMNIISLSTSNFNNV
jgi:hypothetical protein